jgi:ribonuclease Z
MAEGKEQRIVVLGSGPALARATQDNTFFCFDSPGGSLLIDCAGSPFHKLLKAGVKPDRLGGVVLTHAHPDHLYGLPSLVHELWLWGRRDVLHVYANSQTESVAIAILDAFHLREKPVPLEFHLIGSQEESLLLENESYVLETSPVRHEVPTVATRITSRLSGRVAVYSGDTSPCRELVTLARGADLLLQECGVEQIHPFHCTPAQVGEIASEADVGEVVLVHCHPNVVKEPYVTLALVGKSYRGSVRFAEDFDVYEL